MVSTTVAVDTLWGNSHRWRKPIMSRFQGRIVTTLVSPYILRVAEGVYFTSAAYLHKSINGVKDSNDRLAAYFAAICECNCEQSNLDHK